jgi:hypothetical protein
MFGVFATLGTLVVNVANVEERTGPYEEQQTGFIATNPSLP